MHRISQGSARIKIGAHNLYSVDNARKESQKLAVDINSGRYPRRTEQDYQITLLQAHEEYIAKSSASTRTKCDYCDHVKNHFPDWQGKSLDQISKVDIESRFLKISQENGKIAANNAFKYLQSLYEWRAAVDENLKNPVIILKQRKLFHPNIRRQNYVKNSDLSLWYCGLMQLENDSFRDAILFALLTGLRKTEVFELEWNRVDFDERKFFIIKTKNGIPLHLPLSTQTFDLLYNRHQNRRNAEFVFDSLVTGKCIVDAKVSIKQISAHVNMASNQQNKSFKFGMHDLRRTFLTKANELQITGLALKRLVNHRSNDVTEGYIIHDVETLREPTQRISDSFFQYFS